MEPLLVVDVQNAFINDYTHHVPARILDLVASGAFEVRYMTRFINTEDGPYVQLLDWNEALAPPATDIVPELSDVARSALIFDKAGITGLPAELRQRLRTDAPDRIAIAGIDTDMCVLKTALDVFDLGIEPIVLTDCCASTAGLQAHFAALSILARNIGANRLHHTGTGGQQLGAPRP